MADKKEYIERGALLENLKKQYGEELGWQCTVNMSDVGMMIEDAPAADVVRLDDLREAFRAYILEMTCSKYGTPEETQFARGIVKQAVDMVLGERNEQT